MVVVRCHWFTSHVDGGSCGGAGAAVAVVIVVVVVVVPMSPLWLWSPLWW